MPSNNLEIGKDFVGARKVSTDDDSDDDEDEQDMVLLLSVFKYDSWPSFWRDPFGSRDCNVKTFKRFWPRILVAVVWYFGCVYVNNLSQAWLQQNIAGFYESKWGYSLATYNESMTWLKDHDPNVYKARWGDTPPNKTEAIQREFQPGVSKSLAAYYLNKTSTLYDIVFLYLPYVKSSAPADSFAGYSMLAALVRYVVVPGPFSMRWTILNRILVIWGTLFICRALCIILTPLPNPYHKCVPHISFPDNIWFEAYTNLPGVFWYNEMTCQDVMFSGHTAMGTVGTLFFMSYMTASPWFGIISATERSKCISLNTLLHFLGGCWLLFGWYVIAASHFHYTVDVLVGALLSVVVFTMYNARIRTATIAKYRHAWSFGSFLQWFELHAADMKIYAINAKTRSQKASFGPLAFESD